MGKLILQLLECAAVGCAGIFGAALSRVLADDLKAWRPRLVDLLIRRATARLSAAERPRYEEEWRSHVDEVPGETAKIAVASAFLLASIRMSLVPSDVQSAILILRRLRNTIDVIWIVILFLTLTNGLLVWSGIDLRPYISSANWILLGIDTGLLLVSFAVVRAAGASIRDFPPAAFSLMKNMTVQGRRLTGRWI